MTNKSLIKKELLHQNFVVTFFIFGINKLVSYSFSCINML